MKLIFYSHSTYSIQINSFNILVDPFFTGNPIIENNSLFYNKNYINNINADYILVTHAHYDHISDVEYIAKRTGAIIISNYEISVFFNKKGINTIGINFGSRIKFDFGYLRYVYANHSSSFPNGIYGGNPGGFILQNGNYSIYIAGDTSLTQEMKIIPKYTFLNLAILPIGGMFTMDYLDALIASDFIKCDNILGVHYDTFPEIKIDHNNAKKTFYDKRKNLILLNIENILEIENILKK